MKKMISTIAFLAITIFSFGQTKGDTTKTTKDTIPVVKKVDSTKIKNGTTIEFKNKNFKFGVGIGFNYATQNIFDASLSPVDKSLQLQKISPFSTVISGTIIYNREVLYKDVITDKDGNVTGLSDSYSSPSPWSFFASINLAELTPTGTFSFNKSIDGGLGVGRRFSIGNQDFHFGLFLEKTTYRQLRDYVMDNYKGKPIPISGQTQPLNALDENDNSLFFNKKILSFSFKFVYMLN